MPFLAKTTLRRDGYRCSYVFRSASMSQPPERYILFVPIVAHSGRDCRSATMIPPFSTLPSAAKIYSRVYAMFVPPARLGQFDVYRAAPGRSYQGNKKAGLKVCLAKVLLFILIFRPHPNPVPICRFNVISRDNKRPTPADNIKWLGCIIASRGVNLNIRFDPDERLS